MIAALIEAYIVDETEEPVDETTAPSCLALGCYARKVSVCFSGRVVMDGDNILNSPSLFLDPQHMEETLELLDNKALLDEILQDIRDGNVTAHLTPEALEAVSVVNRLDSLSYIGFKEELKKLKIFIRDFEREVKRYSAAGRSFTIQNSGAAEKASIEWPDDPSGRFTVDSDVCTCKIGTEDGEKKKICDFVARITHYIYYRDCHNPPVLYLKITGMMIGGRKLPDVVVPSTEFPGMGWIMEHWGCDPIIRSGVSFREVQEAIQRFSIDVSKEDIYTCIGWHKINGKWKYLHSGGCVGDESVNVEIGNTSIVPYRLPDTTGDLKMAIAASMELLDVANRRITLPLTAIIFLSVMCEFLRMAGCDPRFVLYLIGRTGTFKTTLAILFLSHFGKFTGPPASFKDTINSLEHKAFVCKDALLLIDDFHPANSKQEEQRMTGVIQQVLRAYGDRVCRARMGAGMKAQKQFPPKGVPLVTAEHFTQGESSNARSFAEEVLEGDVNIEKLTDMQGKAHLLGQSMRGFVEWLSKTNKDVLVDMLKEGFQEARSAASDIEGHKRLADTVALLYIGFTYFCKYAIMSGVMTNEESENLYDEAWNIFVDLAEKQHKLVSKHDPVNIFLSTFTELLESKSIYTLPLRSSGRVGEVDYTQGSKFVGYHDENFYYLIPATIYEQVNTLLYRRNSSLRCSEAELWRRLAEKGLIKAESSEKSEHIHPKVQVSAERKRYVHLRRGMLDD